MSWIPPSQPKDSKTAKLIPTSTHISQYWLLPRKGNRCYKLLISTETANGQVGKLHQGICFIGGFIGVFCHGKVTLWLKNSCTNLVKALWILSIPKQRYKGRKNAPNISYKFTAERMHSLCRLMLDANWVRIERNYLSITHPTTDPLSRPSVCRVFQLWYSHTENSNIIFSELSFKTWYWDLSLWLF